MPATDFSALRQMETVQITQIIDGLRLSLKDKRIFQLAGIEVPGISQHSPSDIAISARDYLKELLDNQSVRLYQTKKSNTGRTNRMGYHLVHLQRTDGTWIQGALIAKGLARTLPTQRNPEMAEQMYALEKQARENKAGMWADESYAVLTPENAQNGMNSFSIIEGTVRKAALVRNRLYLNFGDDWRTDFTVAIEPAIRKQLARSGVNPLDLGRKRVRVRGWLESWNGPYLKLDDASQLEILEPES